MRGAGSSSLTMDSATPPPMQRLEDIRAELEEMGASREYCLQYFRVLGGKCEEHRCQQCVRHAPGVAQLPATRMCKNAYEAYLGQLRGKFQLLKDEMVQHRVAWNQIRQEELAASFLNTTGSDGGPEGSKVSNGPEWLHHYLKVARRMLKPGVFQAVLKDKRLELEQIMLHNKGLGYRLKAERQALLANVQPVDAARWHERVSRLLDEEMDIREVLNMGHLVEPILPRGSV